MPFHKIDFAVPRNGVCVFPLEHIIQRTRRVYQIGADCMCECVSILCERKMYLLLCCERSKAKRKQLSDMVIFAVANHGHLIGYESGSDKIPASSLPMGLEPLQFIMNVTEALHLITDKTSI